MNMNKDGPFQAESLFHFADDDDNGCVIVDSQKPGENVASFGYRIFALLTDKGLSEDPVFMCRVFVGGLRPTLMHSVLLLMQNIDPCNLFFRRVFFFVQFLENMRNDAMISRDLGEVFPPKWRAIAQSGNPSTLQDGLQFGEPNELIDALYQRGPTRSMQKILYRR